MTVPAVARVDVGSLSLGSELGAGGQGSVTAVDHFLIDRQWSAVLKTYSPDAAAVLRPAVLEELVRFPRRLGAGESRWLHEHTAWPAVVVEDNDVVSGFLMRCVPPPFHFGFRTQTQGTRSRLADVAFLLNSDEYVRSAGLAVSDQDRLALLMSLAGTLSRLHSLGVVIGDLSPKNLLFSPGPSPDCFVIDCDTVRLHGETVLDQVDTPDWESPANEPRATVATDAYKFGLLAIRLFARDQSARDEAALAAVSPELGRFAERSLHDDPAARPRPESWLPALEAAAAAMAAAAVAAAVRPGIPAAVTGTAATGRPAPVTVPADMVADVVSEGGPPPRRGGARVFVLVAVLLVIIAAVAGAVLVLHKGPGPASAADTPGSVAGQPGATTPSIPASSSPASSSPASPAGSGWSIYQDPGEFSIMLPAGWSVRSQSADEVYFTGQPAGFVVLVAWTTQPKPDAYTDWQQQAAGKALADPTYHQISIRRVNYRGYNTADWEFVNEYHGTLTHVVDRGFVVVPGQLGYAIELYGPDAGFAPVYAAMWNKLVTSFEPAA